MLIDEAIQSAQHIEGLANTIAHRREGGDQRLAYSVASNAKRLHGMLNLIEREDDWHTTFEEQR